MHLYEFLIENRTILKSVYTLLIVLICFFIVLRTNKLFKLSLYQGIRYFRNAFFFYGCAFLLRYIFIGTYDFPLWFFGISEYSSVIKIFFEFFFVMAGFFLLYSLLWSKIERSKEGSESSIINFGVIIFYSFAIIISLLDYFWTTFYFMFLSQIIVFSFALGAAFAKFATLEKKAGFLKLYLFVIVLNLVLWIVNAVVFNSFEFVISSSFDLHRIGIFGIYIMNIFIFFLFLIGVIKSTKR